MTTALDAVLPALRCPVCRDRLARDAGGLACPRGHRFDVARQGYVNLLAGRRGAATGDDAAMVAARWDVLAAGRYAPLTAALVDACAGASGLVVDVGAGTGQHLAAVVDACAATAPVTGLALDTSAPALRRAARVHPRVAAVGADVWGRLPLADGAAAVVLDVFSPRNGEEFARVLADDGRLVVAVPTGAHLGELVAAAGLLGVDADKAGRLAAQLGPRFEVEAERVVTWTLDLDAATAATLVAMTPSARHVPHDEVLARLAGAGPLAVTASVRLLTARPRRPARER